MSATLNCFHCCHTITGNVEHLPISYDRETNKFTFFGNFCSYECMKTYNLELNDSFTNKRFMYISMLFKENKNINSVKFAHSRTKLKEYGGHLSIEEFREGFAKTNNSNVDNTATDSLNDINIQSCIQYQPNVVKNQPVKLKRSKPLKNSQNTLENTMGIFKTGVS